jgi:hypothetical protein
MEAETWHAWPVNDTVFFHYLDRVVFACQREDNTVLYTNDPSGFGGDKIKWKLLPRALPW